MTQSATFRIYTEDINRDKIQKLLSKYFKGFTLFEAQGFWRLQKENSLVIEILGETDILERVNQVAKEIKETNNQEAVLVQKLKNNHWLI